MKAKVKQDQPAFKLRAGDIIDVEPFGRCKEPYRGQEKYRVKGASFWLPEEDLEILN